MFKMGLHDSFEHLKHKLWLKKGLKIKLVIWPGESCESVFAHGSSVHQKCSSYAQTNLLFGLCKSVWVNDLFINFLSPIPEL
jgi:hypothetical protein